MSRASDHSRDPFHVSDPDGMDSSHGHTSTAEIPASDWDTHSDGGSTAHTHDAYGRDTAGVPTAARPQQDSQLRWRDYVVLDTLRSLVRHRILCLLLVGAATFVGSVVTMFMQPFYVAQAKIYPPMNENPLGGFGIPGVAGLLGNLGMSAGGTSQFPLYEQVLFGRDLLGKMLASEMPAAGADATVADHLGVEESDPALREAIGISVLRESLGYDADTKTAVATITAKDSDPKAAAFLANRAVELLNEFDISTSTSQAADRRRFIEGRLLVAARDLAEAETRLTEFSSQNLRTTAHDLLLEEQRLIREAKIAQEVYLTLRKEAELAAIEEHRSVPVVNVLERATPPFAPAGPSWVRNGFVAGVLASAFVVVFFAIRAIQPLRWLASLGLTTSRA